MRGLVPPARASRSADFALYVAATLVLIFRIRLEKHLQMQEMFKINAASPEGLQIGGGLHRI